MKKLLSAMIACAMLFSLAACGAKGDTKTDGSKSGSTSTASSGTSDNYPTKPITDIVPTSAGGSTDLYQRLIGNYIEKYLGQSFVVENKTGGAQVIGVTAIKDSAPDGYTIGVGWGASFGMRPYLLDVTYSMDDFQFICGVLEQKNVIIVRGDSEWNTLDDLKAAMEANPGKINYGAGASGSFQYVWAAYIMNQMGVTANMIPHDGDAGAVVSLQSGAVDWVSCEPTSCVSALKSGDVKVLVNCGTERDPGYPDAPSLTELGYESVLSHTMAIVCPAAVPAERVEKLRAAIEQVLQDPDFIAQCESAGYAYSYKTGEECIQEIHNMEEVIKPMIDAGVFG